MISNSLLSPLWAILPNYANKIYGAHERQVEFYAKRNPEEMKGNFNCNIDINDNSMVPESFTVNDGVGVLPVMGMVIPKSDFFTIFFGGFAALDVLERDFRILLGREDVHTIVLDIDSPGGNAFGVQQFANLIFESRNIKSIISVTSSVMASAAVWVGAAAHKMFITGDVTVTGSIGTITTHTDISEFHKQIGITQTEIVAGKFKRIPSALQPLDDEGRAVLQNQVNQANKAFVTDMARFKNIKPLTVNKMAEGKVFIGAEAIIIGLIDGMISMEGIFSSMDSKENAESFITTYIPVITTSSINNNFNSFNGGQKMTLIEQIANMKTENVDLYNAIIEKGKLEAKADFDAALPDVKAVEHAKGVEAGKVSGRDEGILAERGRISDLTELSNASSKEMVDKFIADGTTTAPEAAVEILKAQGASNATKLKNLETGSPKPIDGNSIDTNEETGDSEKGLRQLVTEYVAQHKCTKGVAITACFKAYPNAKNDFAEPVKK